MNWNDIKTKKPGNGDVVLIRKNCLFRVVKFHSELKVFEEIATKNFYHIEDDCKIVWATIKEKEKSI